MLLFVTWFIVVMSLHALGLSTTQSKAFTVERLQCPHLHNVGIHNMTHPLNLGAVSGAVVEWKDNLACILAVKTLSFLKTEGLRTSLPSTIPRTLV
jgi:hypothetical protein